MKYEELILNIGNRVSIKEGQIILDPLGNLEISYQYKPYTIYLNKLTQTFNIILPRNEYIGREYQFRKADCITLVAEWLDDNFNSSFSNLYSKMTKKDFLSFYEIGLETWFIQHNFQKVNSLMHGDIIIYAYRSETRNHAGIYLEPGKILHHMPDKLSCIDEIDESKILERFRYNGN